MEYSKHIKGKSHYTFIPWKGLVFITISIFLLMNPMIVKGQEHTGRKYTVYEAKNGIEVSGIWKHEKLFHNGKMMLCLKVKNRNTQATKVAFEVNFFNVAVLAETYSIEEMCIASMKQIKGRRGGLCFISEELSNDDLMNENFHWSIDELEIEQVPSCDN